MALTPEQLKMNAAAMVAFADGKPIEFRRKYDEFPMWKKWDDTSGPNWLFDTVEYRPKPEPVCRPWSKPEHVPGPVCWLMLSTQLQSDFVTLVLTIGETGVRVMDDSGRCLFLIYQMLDNIATKYSTDLKTWRPCTVEEPC